jgi:glutathione S-transferase
MPRMKYTLVGSLRSPFVRAVRLFFLQNKIEFDFKVINFLEVPADAEYLAQLNPINKVPVLIEGQSKLFDSRVIFNVLTQRHGLVPLTLDEENMLSAVYSALDVSVNLFLLQRGGLDPATPNQYVERQRARLVECLHYLAPWAQGLRVGRDWRFPAMSLYSYLFWARARGLLDLSAHPELAKFVEDFRDAPGVAATTFPAS